MLFFNEIHKRVCFQSMKDNNKTRRKMEKIEDDDAIIFSYTTPTLACTVDKLSNEKAKKSRNCKTSMKN